jgi:tetratricopeptide (TPR) repeat protein
MGAFSTQSTSKLKILAQFKMLLNKWRKKEITNFCLARQLMVGSAYNKAIELNPNLAAAYGNRGLVKKAKGDLDGALDDFNKAIGLKPNLAAAYNLGRLVKRSMGFCWGSGGAASTEWWPSGCRQSTTLLPGGEVSLFFSAGAEVSGGERVEAAGRDAELVGGWVAVSLRCRNVSSTSRIKEGA